MDVSRGPTSLSEKLAIEGKREAKIVFVACLEWRGVLTTTPRCCSVVCVFVHCVDLAQVVKNGKVPAHDVVVTNPPFSGEHVPKILSFCAREDAKPWFLLLPNYVYLKVLVV